MALSQTWPDVTQDPPYKKTGEVWDQTTIEKILNALYALAGSDGTSGFCIPIGGQIPYCGASAPSGGFWKIADGSAVSRTTYATLFGIQSTTYGSGDGSTTFNLNDKRFRVSVGRDNMGQGAAGRAGSHTATQGGTGGETDHALVTGEEAVHSHGVPTVLGGGGGSGIQYDSASAGTDGGSPHPTNNAGSGTAHNTMQPYEVDTWLVRVL